VNIGQFGISKESADDARALLEPLQGIDRDGFQLVSGQRYSPGDPVVFDILVDPFVRVQLGSILIRT